MNFQYNYAYGPVDNYAYGGNCSYSSGCPTGPMSHCSEVSSPEHGLETQREEPRIPIISVKIITPSRKSEYKTFLVRDVTANDVQSLANLRGKFVEELGADLLAKDLQFDLGYYRGNKRMWIRNNSDLSDLLVRSSEKDELTLWCEGISTKPTTSGKRKKKSSCASRPADYLEISSDSDSSTDKPKAKKKKKTLLEEKQDRIDEIVDELREKHRSQYTSLQYRVWAETIVASQHKDTDKPPRGSFFCQSQVFRNCYPYKAACIIRTQTTYSW